MAAIWKIISFEYLFQYVVLLSKNGLDIFADIRAFNVSELIDILIITDLNCQSQIAI